MKTGDYEVMHQEGAAPVKMWIHGVPMEAGAEAQLARLARMPFVYKWIAVMPDVHVGIGATIGSVVPTQGAIIPAAVGVDIGCGMMAARLTLAAGDLPDGLQRIRAEIERAVPCGFNHRSKIVGAWGDLPPTPVAAAWAELADGFARITAKNPKLEKTNHRTQLGTLGSGNHFIEICLDEAEAVWIMLHSGSRGVGNAIGRLFIEQAKEDMRRWFINLLDGNCPGRSASTHEEKRHSMLCLASHKKALTYYIMLFIAPVNQHAVLMTHHCTTCCIKGTWAVTLDEDLAYLPEGTEHFEDYLEAVHWAQEYARINRILMMDAVIAALRGEIAKPFQADVEVVNCHHNYVARESHYGQNVWVTRKGAVRARAGDLGIIPGSMGARSYIVRGLGKDESFCSCSHGAGRLMSRTEARRRFTQAEHALATAGVECRKDEAVIDETPAAYKSIDAVMEAQKELVAVVHTLKQVLCVKG